MMMAKLPVQKFIPCTYAVLKEEETGPEPRRSAKVSSCSVVSCHGLVLRRRLGQSKRHGERVDSPETKLSCSGFQDLRGQKKTVTVRLISQPLRGAISTTSSTRRSTHDPVLPIHSGQLASNVLGSIW